MRKETDGVLDKIRVYGKPRHHSIIITGHDNQLLLFHYLEMTAIQYNTHHITSHSFIF